jgi:hypothetical protein
MTQGLRIVPQKGTGGWVYLLWQEAQRVRPATQDTIQLQRLIELTLLGEVVHQPEATDQESAFASR